ncbi:histone acetyltransferase subunit NuA4-domain-containing protein [Elsinoe ampelina]|uniref:Chromatin modification-related protein EAF6 n=1 Tax=Elsinoe ampelina TaxID=302913 RepID=A0A6A6G856_9PEZI|nr:histone acetyltransferase subunit NuA4-domain-containing protein [Elsinoe ampelina]
MTENLPPSGGANGSTTDQPGRPYYESLRSTLRGTLAKKRALDEQLASLEEHIYKLETNYLEDTSGAGNIVRGFDNWVKGVVVGNDRRGDDRKARARVREEDRIFSNSSMTWIRSQESPGDTSNANTPSHAPTPTSGVPPSMRALDHATPGSTTSKGGSKKKKALDKDEDDESKPAKRSKISYGRG